MSVKRNIKKMALAAILAGMLGSLTGCFIQPDPTLDPLQISDGTVPFGTVQALPTNTPTPVPQSTPSPTPDTWQSSDQSTWEDWSSGSLPTTTPKTAATAAPGAQSWQTSTQDYNAGYPVLRVGSTGSDVQRFAGAADRAGLLHRHDRRQILHRHAERRYGVPKPKRSHGGRHCGPRDAGQALFRVGAAQDSQRQHDGKRLYAAQGGRIRFGGAQIAGPSGGAGLLRGRRGWHLRLDDDQRCEGLPAGERTERRRTGGHADADEAIFRECEIRNQSGDDGEPGSDAHVERRHDGQRRLRFAGAAD